MSAKICKQCGQRPTASEQNEYCEDCFHYNFLSDPDPDDEEEGGFVECDDCDGHDACKDFGCAIWHGLGHLVQPPL